MWQVAGHDWAVDMLNNSLAEDKVSHAYLFTGPPGIGKSRLALNLAQALLCEAEDRPCGECEPCRKTLKGIHPDVRMVDLRYQARLREEPEERQTELRADTVRIVTQEAGLKPFEARRKILVIPDAESMNPWAANALLKTLEEPPPHVVLLLSAIDTRLLLPTIVSRCQVFALRPVPHKIIEDELVVRRGVDAERGRLLARLSSGRIGWAIRASQDPSMLQRREETLRELATLPRMGRLDRLEFARRLAGKTDTIQDTLELWLSWWRDLLLMTGGNPDAISNLDLAPSLQQEAVRYDLRGVLQFVKAIHSTQRALEMNADARLALEVLMLSLPAQLN